MFPPQIVLAFGNYMNSSKKGAAYGFRLQSLDLVSIIIIIIIIEDVVVIVVSISKQKWLYLQRHFQPNKLLPRLSFQLLETKSTDRSQTLLHFMTNIIQDKYPDLVNFHTELHFVDKAALGKRKTYSCHSFENAVMVCHLCMNVY